MPGNGQQGGFEDGVYGINDPGLIFVAPMGAPRTGSLLSEQHAAANGGGVAAGIDAAEYKSPITRPLFEDDASPADIWSGTYAMHAKALMHQAKAEGRDYTSNDIHREAVTLTEGSLGPGPSRLSTLTRQPAESQAATDTSASNSYGEGWMQVPVRTKDGELTHSVEWDIPAIERPAQSGEGSEEIEPAPSNEGNHPSVFQRIIRALGDARRDIASEAREEAMTGWHEARMLVREPSRLALGALVIAAQAWHPQRAWQNPSWVVDEIAGRAAGLRADDPQARQTRWDGYYATAAEAAGAKRDAYLTRVIEPRLWELRAARIAQLQTLENDQAEHAAWIPESFSEEARLRAADQLARSYAGEVAELQEMGASIPATQDSATAQEFIARVAEINTRFDTALRELNDRYSAAARERVEQTVANAHSARAKRIKMDYMTGVNRLNTRRDSRYYPSYIDRLATRWADHVQRADDAARAQQLASRTPWQRAADRVLARHLGMPRP